MNDQTKTIKSIETGTGPDFVIGEQWFGRIVVVAASGVVDMLTSPQLQACIAASLDKEPTAVIVDLTAVDFLASAGMSVLVDARDRLSPGVRFGVVASGPATSRPLKLVGLGEVLGLYSTLAQARAALGD